MVLYLYLKSRTELVLETSEHFSVLTRLIAREYFIEFSRRENIKTYIYILYIIYSIQYIIYITFYI
jgi:hypothetical protein